MAKGYKKIWDIDYNETFNPVVKLQSTKTKFAYVVVNNIEIHQMDVKTAFLHDEIQEELYITQLDRLKSKAKNTRFVDCTKLYMGYNKLQELGLTRLFYALCILDLLPVKLIVMFMFNTSAPNQLALYYMWMMHNYLE